MLQIIGCELKRILTSRSTWIALLVAGALSVAISFLVISFETYYYIDNAGTVVELTGFKAIQAKKENQGLLKGELTEEKLRDAYNKYMEVCAQYDNNVENVPLDVYYKELYPISNDLERILAIFMNDETGYYITNIDLSDDDIDQYYEVRDQYIQKFVRATYGEDAADTVASLNKKVKNPFVNEFAINANAIEYIPLLQWLLILIAVILIAPQFAVGYQTQADDIQRCTKYGRVKLALSKIISSLLVAIPMQIICMSIYLVFVLNAYEWSGMGNSVQTIRTTISIAPITVQQLFAILIACGLICTVAMCAVTLFASAFAKTPTNALILSLGVHLLPALITIISGSNIANWMKSIAPTGGTGLLSGVLYELCTSVTFLNIGSGSIWTPYVMIVAPIIYIPLFICLAVYAYCKYER